MMLLGLGMSATLTANASEPNASAASSKRSGVEKKLRRMHALHLLTAGTPPLPFKLLIIVPRKLLRIPMASIHHGRVWH